VGDFEAVNDRLKQELNHTKENLNKETRLRMDGDKQNQEHEFNLREKEKEIKRLVQDLELMRNKNDKFLEDNTRLYSENEKCKSHIGVTTEQNNRVCILYF